METDRGGFDLLWSCTPKLKAAPVIHPMIIYPQVVPPISIFNKKPHPQLHRNHLTTHKCSITAVLNNDKLYVHLKENYCETKAAPVICLFRKWLNIVYWGRCIFKVHTHISSCLDILVSKKISCCLQVREAAITTLVDVYRHVGEKVRADLGKRGLPAARWVIAVSVEHHLLCARGGVFVCVVVLQSGDDLLWSVWPSVCPTPHHAPLCPSQGHWISTMLTDQKRHRRRVQIACKDNIVGGVTWLEVCAYVFLKENLLSGFILFWLSRWPLLCADCSGWALCLWMLAGAMCHVLCILRLVCFHYKHIVYLCGNRRALCICLFNVLYSRQMQWFKTKLKYMSYPL